MNVLMEWADCKQVKPFSGMDKILSNLFTTFLNLYLNYINGNINAWKIINYQWKTLKNVHCSFIKFCQNMYSESRRKYWIKLY